MNANEKRSLILYVIQIKDLTIKKSIAYCIRKEFRIQ